MKIEIKNRFNNSVLFSHDCEENTLKITLLMALKASADLRRADLRVANLGGVDLGGADLGGANLRGANLGGADLGGADLGGADLRRADLREANLGGADLGGANLRGANLRGADLGGANLGGADLRGANLGGADLGDLKLVGGRPFMQIGPIGSRNDYLTAFITDKGVHVQAGCFFGSRDQFELKVAESHGSNEHGKEYRAALVLIDAHAEIWTPKEPA